jgi:uncharacterized protein (TIGR03435 family)
MSSRLNFTLATFVSCAIACATPFACAQNSAPSYEFDAVSIREFQRPNGPFSFPGFAPGFTADGYRVGRNPLTFVLVAALGVRLFQIEGVPDWVKSNLYDIEAKMDPATADALKALPPDQRKLAQQQMLQSLFADRFALKWHREVKDGPIYFLVVAKNGSKLKLADPNNKMLALGPDGKGVPAIWLDSGAPGNIKDNATSIDMPALARYLSGELRRPVIDKTGLTGAYDFTLEYRQDSPQATALDDSDADLAPAGAVPTAAIGGSIFSALESQLGLKLEPGRGPVETIIIDHIDHPSSN